MMMMMMQADKIERQRVTCSSLYGRRFEFFGEMLWFRSIRVECVIQVENSIPLMETHSIFWKASLVIPEKNLFSKHNNASVDKYQLRNKMAKLSVHTNLSFGACIIIAVMEFMYMIAGKNVLIFSRIRHLSTQIS